MSEEEKVDLVNHPKHYTSEVGDQYEHFKVVEAWNLSYCTGCATKYIKRAGLKDGSDPIEDLRKAIRYIEMEIQNIKGGRQNAKANKKIVSSVHAERKDNKR